MVFGGIAGVLLVAVVLWLVVRKPGNKSSNESETPPKRRSAALPTMESDHLSTSATPAEEEPESTSEAPEVLQNFKLKRTEDLGKE